MLNHLLVERAGTGPAMVLTHGGGDTLATWVHQTGHFAPAGWATTAWDLRGHGKIRGAIPVGQESL